MYSRSRDVIVAAAALVLIGCQREERAYREISPAAAPVNGVRMTPLQPGVPTAQPVTGTEYVETAYSISQGQQLYLRFNCVGCHSHGGGGSGPPLMDEKWIYGSEPANIFSSIVEGRPNGMPSFGAKVPRQQIWQLAAYVRSLAGLAAKDAIPARSDTMQNIPARNIMPADKPAP